MWQLTPNHVLLDLPALPGSTSIAIQGAHNTCGGMYADTSFALWEHTGWLADENAKPVTVWALIVNDAADGSTLVSVTDVQQDAINAYRNALLECSVHCSCDATTWPGWI